MRTALAEAPLPPIPLMVDKSIHTPLPLYSYINDLHEKIARYYGNLPVVCF